jgi:hypothetical protein
MKIFYIILSCAEYANTRQQWQKDTWLKGQDYIYLDDDQGGGYKDAPKKYVRYLREAKREHDYYFFCDDDTFVYTKKLEAILKDVSINEMIGFKGGEFKIYNLNIGWCSGGAGILMNWVLFHYIQMHLLTTPHPIITDETDISLAIWAAMSSDVQVIDNKRFSPFKTAETTVKDCITYHYCDKNDFMRLGVTL